MSKSEDQYDVIIVGSGVAGLYTAVELLRANRRLRILVAEKYATVGGRASTFHLDLSGEHLQWEAGAGRISKHHTHLMELLHRYKLTFIPIGGTIHYKAGDNAPLEPNLFEPAIPAMIDTLAGLPKELLARSTLRQLLVKVHGPARTDAYLIRFPYRAELETMRADRALDLFRHEMRRHADYGICKEGLSAVVEGMRKEVEQRGGRVQTHLELVGVRSAGSGRGGLIGSFREGPPREGTGRPERELHCRELVLAIPIEALREVRGLEGWKGGQHLTMRPLLRFYGAFPKDADGRVWYEKTPALEGRLVTPGPLRYVIPGNPAIGSIQMSYTDSQDAEHWMGRLKAIGERGVGEEILAQLRALVTPQIPAPTFVKAHAWKHGVSYWLPGAYEPEEISREAWTPFPEKMPGLHLCGESYSLRQGWIEGALEHAAGLLPKILRRLRRE